MSGSGILSFSQHPDTPFPIGVEYYRAPIPKQSLWDEDFARIRAAGLHIVRSFSFWNWMEPKLGVYRLEDFDLLFDLAEKHGLFVWLDITLATHGACPEWLTRQHPDIVVVDDAGQAVPTWEGNAAPQGGMTHCYDHPQWREHGGNLLRYVVERYRERPNLLIWGLWDGICAAHLSASRHSTIHSCYCEHTKTRYIAWLQNRFSLDEFNRYAMRRYGDWEDVAIPRTTSAVLEMRLLQEFHRDNLVGHLDWMVAETRRIDPRHEVRAHGAHRPRPWDEVCAARVDSWGMSMPSNNLLASSDPYRIAERAFIFDCSRSLGVRGRWWNEEIYAGMSPGGPTWNRQSDPRELTMLTWMSLAHGAAGVMYWQYRPEYLSFESPGYNLMALDGEPTARFDAVVDTAAQIERLHPHLPLEFDRAQVGIVYHPESQELFGFGGQTERFDADLRGVYRTLWTEGVAADILTPNQDWSGYRLIFLPNVALMTDSLRMRIETTLSGSADTLFVAEGSFGVYSADGQSSYGPPEGFMTRFGMRIADFGAIDEREFSSGGGRLTIGASDCNLTTPCGYAVLEPAGDTNAVAYLDDQCVGLRTADGRFTWFGLSLSAGFGDVGQPDIVRALLAEADVRSPVELSGDRVVPIVRQSCQGGHLLFLFNLEEEDADAVVVRPTWQVSGADDLLNRSELEINGEGKFPVQVAARSVAVAHLQGE